MACEPVVSIAGVDHASAAPHQMKESHEHPPHPLMVWPITERGLTMTPGELIDDALDAICECNSRLDYPRLILMPSPAAFVIDRSAATIGAECEWVWKRDIRKGTS